MTQIDAQGASRAAQGRRFQSFSEASSFIWSIADLLRGDYKQHDFGKVVLPFTVLRRLDGVLAGSKAKVLAAHEKQKGGAVKNLDPILNRITGVHFHNTSKLDFKKLLDDPNHIAANLNSYLKGFSESVREIFIERFKFPAEVSKLDDANVLFLVVQRFADLDLSPEAVPNHVMGSIFEDLIRRFAEQSNETAGEHFTPREVIRLMVNLLFMEDRDVLTKKGVVKTMLDPACGTGGMLSVAEDYLIELNPDAHLEVFGQELNDESYAICKADMLIKAENPENVIYGNSFSKDGHAGKKFDYLISNPPFGVEWKKVEKEIKDEAETLGHAGRFGAGLPRINDGSFLFLQHMISKMKPAEEGGSRIAIVFNGSPLFTGDAGSGESEIRRWIIENDWLEAIVALPDQLFFNTGIFTYVWIVTNRKAKKRRGKVQLVNAVDIFQKTKKSLGNKRNEIGREQLEEITRTYGDFNENERSKVFANEAFGYRKITVERPLRLSFQASPERVARLEAESGFKALAASKKKGKAGEAEAEEGKELQAQLLTALGKLDRKKIWKSRDAFEEALESVLKKAGLKLAAPTMKAVLAALGGRDEDADVCKDGKGRIEPDVELRDNENVPLTERIEDYFEREVKPHVPDAWIDEKARVGYEIPLTRHFYRPTEPTPLGQIEEELLTLDREILRALTARQALVAQAVTTGLNPSAPMKDSGVPGLNRIAAHWRVAKLGHLLFDGPRNGVSPPLTDVGVGVRSFSIAVIRHGRFSMSEDDVKWVAAAPEDQVQFDIRRDDLLLVRGNGNIALVGTCGLVSESLPGFVYPDLLMRLRVRSGVSPRFLTLAINSAAIRVQIESAARTSVGTYKVNNEQIRQVRVPVPNLAEAERICDFIEARERATEAVLALEQQRAELLRRHHQGLVSAAITGQFQLSSEPR